ncbi:MAG: GAF domain-containing protein, partial [Thermodesulfobacteriota bacterium]|nr:GAF domain-containing protein [Thermodesulfobacteriota bacterium]
MEGVSRWDYPDDIAICVALEAQRGWFSLDELSLFIFPEIKKPTDLLKAVEGLIARGWIVQDARQGVGYYRFTEDINEFAKSTEIDTPLHRRMAQYFEDKDEYAHKAAYHWEAAGETMLAFRCWTRAIDVCFDTGRDAKGMEITGHAFRLVGEDKLPQGFEDEFLNAFIHLFESRSVFRSHPEIDTIVDDVMRICEAGPGSALTLMAMVYVISSLIWRGRFRQAMPVFITFFKKSRSDRSPEMMEIRKRILGVAYYVQGKISRAARIFDSISADTDQLPEDSVLLEYYLAVAHCYGLCGRISRSIALLDSIRQHAYARGYHGVEGWALATLGVILIETGRYERAGQVIKELEDISGWERHYLSHMESLWTRVYLEYSRGHHHEMAEYLSRLGTKVQKRFPDFFTPTQAELSIALSHMDPGILENTGLSPFVKMSQKMIKDFSRIPAYRLTARIYQAFYAFVSSGDAEAALSEIKDASDLLEARGYYLVVGKARIIEATILCDQARIDEAVSVLNGYAHIIGEFGEDLFGGYLKDLVSPESPQRLLFDAVIGISQALGTLSDKDALIQKALETIGRICHAEREALFMYEGDKGARSLVLKASQGITRQYAQSDAFCQMFEWIEETAHMTKGRIWRSSNESRGKFQPRAAICAPLIIRGEVVGVIYMDNRIIQDAFDFADIQLIGSLATQVAASVENSRAYKKI